MADRHRYTTTASKRSVVLIINNGEFESHTGLGNREGYIQDGTNLTQAFNDLHFDVKPHQNVKADDMLELVKEASRDEEHRERDCFACVIMTHGGENDVVWGTDRQVDIEDLLQPFKREKCPLLGKPKLFFIQACRGTNKDYGAALGVEGDSGEEKVQRIPLEADFLVAFSTVKGFYSYRNRRDGSWFIQGLCDVIRQYLFSLDVMTMMTRVNREVALEYEAAQQNTTVPGRKQMPCIMSMLTKDFFFVEKN